jgi:hypothetical protein
MNQPKPFNIFNSVTDMASFGEPAPKGAKRAVIAEGGGRMVNFVPVSFVAKDWNVTPRRIRALLSAGRLDGRVQVNGYWEVRYPYSFVFGTRGPSLKRQQKPAKRPQLVAASAERSKV